MDVPLNRWVGGSSLSLSLSSRVSSCVCLFGSMLYWMAWMDGTFRHGVAAIEGGLGGCGQRHVEDFQTRTDQRSHTLFVPTHARTYTHTAHSMAGMLGRDIVGEAVSQSFIEGLKEEAAEKAAEKATAAQRERQWQAMKAAEERENNTRFNSGTDSDDDDLLEDPELEDIRKKRMAKLMAGVEKKKEAVVSGHGDYRTIAETDFLKEVCTTNKVVVHFFHNDFERCKIMDKHLELICKEHKAEIKVVKIDAEKAPFFVNKLMIRVLPTVVFFTNGISCPPERIVGFEGLPNGDEFTTRDLEEVMVQFEVFAEAKFPETQLTGHIEAVDKVKGERIATGTGRSVYGFGRAGSDESGSDDDEVGNDNTQGRYY